MDFISLDILDSDSALNAAQSALRALLDARPFHAASRHSATLSELRDSPRSPSGDSITEKVSSLFFIELPQAHAAVDELQEHADVADDELRAQQAQLQLQGSHYRHTMRWSFTSAALSQMLQEEADHALKEAALRWRVLRKARDALELRLSRAVDRLNALQEKRRSLLPEVDTRVRVSLVFLQCQQELQRREALAQHHAVCLERLGELEARHTETVARVATLGKQLDEALVSSGKLAGTLGEEAEIASACLSRPCLNVWSVARAYTCLVDA